jgi:hypothetical protein
MAYRDSRLTLRGDFYRRSVAAERRPGGLTWPNESWREDPVGFARTILGVDLWDFQKEFLEAIRDHRHVACAGGRKIGKDFVVAIAALWWYCSYPKARVFLLAPTSKQLDGIAYREIRMLLQRSGRCFDCVTSGAEACIHSMPITGAVGLLARNGIKSDDFREIVGYTAVNEGGLRGLSGANILAIEDEASDIKEEFNTALLGNLAGSNCHRVLISNPTKTSGFFFRAFHEEKELYKTLQVSSESTPNVIAGRDLFPGIADRQWIQDREKDWGRGSPNWAAGVDGKFVTAEQGQLFSLQTIQEAELRWEECEAEGRLCIGVDIAGESFDGDETAFATRRGHRVLELYTVRGLTPEGILEHIRSLVRKYGQGRGEDTPKVVVDRDGQTGARVFDTVNAYRRRNEVTEREFALVGFRGGDPPKGRMGEIYRYTRDALFGGLVDAFREGLAIPSDHKLEAELASIKWQDSERGKSRLCPKSDIKDRLGRSPDRLDALALCTWAEHAKPWHPVNARPAPRAMPAPVEAARRGLDPYAGGIDPYGGGLR